MIVDNHTLNHPKSICIIHITSKLFLNTSSLKFILSISLTKTVDILIAKHITTGENMIDINDSRLKYPQISLLFHFPSKKPKADSKTIIGDKTIAIQIIATLIRSTKRATAKGIAIASACPKVNIHDKSFI